MGSRSIPGGDSGRGEISETLLISAPFLAKRAGFRAAEPPLIELLIDNIKRY
jgi:hypothetical protein